MTFFSNLVFPLGLSFALTVSAAPAEDGPPGTLSANALLDPISISDPETSRGLSPYNWIRAPGYVCSSTMGASLQVAFSHTKSVFLDVDTGHLQALPASRYPVLAWSVNQGPVQSHQLLAGERSIALSVQVENPSIDLYIKGISPFEDRYNGDIPVNSVKIVGFEVDQGGTPTPSVFPSKVWLNIGDSIMSGDAASYAARQGRPSDDNWAASDDGRASYGYLLARHYGYREARVASGGYNWGGGLAGFPPLTRLIDQITNTVSRLNDSALAPKPDVVLVNLGENGIPSSSDVRDALTKIRSRIGDEATMILMIPLSRKGRKELTGYFDSYKSSGLGDSHAFLVDLGDLSYDTADGQHPTALGHQAVCTAGLLKFDPIIQPGH